MNLIVIILLVLLLSGGISTGPWSPIGASIGWGWYGPGAFGLIVIVLLVLLLSGRL